MEKRRFTLRKTERLTDKREIAALFSSGNSLTQFPFRLVYNETQKEKEQPVKITFAVPKRNFKHAVDRNLLKRRMREAFRLNKYTLYDALKENDKHLNIILIYIGKQKFRYRKIEKSITKLLCELPKQAGIEILK